VTITSAVSASSIITGEASSKFGWSVATGDVNGDGFVDVVVGSDLYSSSTGRAYVFHSSGSGGVTITDAVSASAIITGEGGYDGFGYSVAVGDMNGDGYADVVVGAAGYSSGAGRTYVFHSSGGGGVTITSAGSASNIITGESSSNLGYSVVTGDVNGDGFADVVVGAGEAAGTTIGRAYVLHSSGSSGVTITSAAAASTIIVGQAPGEVFGSSVATGDVNGDGFADVVVGGANGSSYVFHSSGGGGVMITSAGSASAIITDHAGSLFGLSVGTRDVNGDGYVDVVVGAPQYSTSTGRAYVFHSSGGGGVTSTAAGSASTIITGEGANNRFGGSVAMRFAPRSSLMNASTPTAEARDKTDCRSCVNRMWLTLSKEGWFRPPSMGRDSLHWFGLNSSERDRHQTYAWVSVESRG
jgi:hypothetical protein